MIKTGFNILNTIEVYLLYKELNYEEFFNQFNSLINEEKINTEAKKRIFQWFQDYIFKQSKSNLEHILKFITGSSRIPISMMITVSFFLNFARLIKLLF